MKTTTTTPTAISNLLPELDNGQIKRLQREVFNHFKGSVLDTLHGSHRILNNAQLESILGLPYTSSGCYAAIWVTNTEAYFDLDKVWKYEGFAMNKDNSVVAIIQDENENTIYFSIS